MRKITVFEKAFFLGAGLIFLSLPSGAAQEEFSPAEFTVTGTVLKSQEKVTPLGVNGWGGSGAIEYAANNFIHNSGNEPIWWKNMHRISKCGAGWFEIDGPGTDWWESWGNGFLEGADVRIYRLVGKNGNTLPLNSQGNYLELENSDHVVLVGKAKVIPAGSPGFPDGGWIANRYSPVFPNSLIRHGNLTCTDSIGVEKGKVYWYAMTSVGRDGKESEISNEVSVTGIGEGESSPHILITTNEDVLPVLKSGEFFEYTPKSSGGKGPYWWQAADELGKPVSLPAGLQIDRRSGRISGTVLAAPKDFYFRLKVVDAEGKSDSRRFTLNPSLTAGDGRKEAILPPANLTATAENGFVALRWSASRSLDIAGYRLKRSVAPAAKQESRVYLMEGTPKLEKFDYVVVEKEMKGFDMKWLNSRIRGMNGYADAPIWHWRSNFSPSAFSLVSHPEPVPALMVDHGQTCLRIDVLPGEQRIFQSLFIRPGTGKDALWYGQLEPGRKYRMKAWLRQKGLAANGQVLFSFGQGYPQIHQTFEVEDQWKEYVFDFIGPAYPETGEIFGPSFAFTGPGILWMDNCRISRVDAEEDTAKPYAPNQTVLQELLKSQPENGPKGVHRIWFLNRDATMSSLLSWHGNSKIAMDWSAQVDAASEMTIPMGLSFDLLTGDGASSRMRPWLVMQHLLHSEEDWLHFIEYLAAPYDPNVDNPQSKPWAYQRYIQRGSGVPWVDEFSEITVEFGNETWHNGHIPDFLGFGLHGAIHQGGKEYGLFTRYLCEVMKKSPYWKSQNLDQKIRFALGGNYDANANWRGKISGYGEEAMQANPYASILGHANYVGPKWETGEYASRNYTDEGIQKCLISFLDGPEAGQIKMARVRESLNGAGYRYDIAAYEGGPGGYALPGNAKADEVETNEKYGKSLAQGVASLDAWMQSYQYGWTDQCFFTYGEGSHWNSHTPLADGFRPTPAWLALTLRNRYAKGDLMRVEDKTVPKFQQGEKEYPMVGVYAMRDKATWSVMIISRALKEAVPVNLELPFKNAKKIMLYRLSGDPRLTNRDKMNIDIQSYDISEHSLKEGHFKVIDPLDARIQGMPPGSIFLYIFEGAQNA